MLLRRVGVRNVKVLPYLLKSSQEHLGYELVLRKIGRCVPELLDMVLWEDTHAYENSNVNAELLCSCILLGRLDINTVMIILLFFVMFLRVSYSL